MLINNSNKKQANLTTFILVFHFKYTAIGNLHTHRCVEVNSVPLSSVIKGGDSALHLGYLGARSRLFPRSAPFLILMECYSLLFHQPSVLGDCETVYSLVPVPAASKMIVSKVIDAKKCSPRVMGEWGLFAGVLSEEAFGDMVRNEVET